MNTSCDVLISGGGIAGLTAAAAFGARGFSVICVDPTPPVTERDNAKADLRSTAFLQPAKAVLDDAGLWQRLAPFAAPLQIMRIIDAGGTDPKPRVVREFNAADVSDLPFGWNLPNWLLRREILARLQELYTVDFRPGIGTKSLLTRTNEARVTLSDTSRVHCRLLLACDGRSSPMRDAAGIDVRTTRYGQKALAFAVTHTQPHENVSTEVHRTGGPFTLVPLPDFEGQPSSAVVWMETNANAERLAALDEAAFTEALNARSCGVLGQLRLTSRRTLWPIISQRAKHLVGERIALMAEAAHVVPPIGAQGLNMSLADLSTLLELASATPEQLGDVAMLSAYDRARSKDVQIRVAGIDLLNRASMVTQQPLRDLRAAGLHAIYALPHVRRMLMQMGLGLRT